MFLLNGTMTENSLRQLFSDHPLLAKRDVYDMAGIIFSIDCSSDILDLSYHRQFSAL
jgi:hypothetical protein